MDGTRGNQKSIYSIEAKSILFWRMLNTFDNKEYDLLYDVLTSNCINTATLKYVENYC